MIKKITLSLCMCFAIFSIWAQKKTPLGHVAGLKDKLSQASSKVSGNNTVSLEVTNGKSYLAQVNIEKKGKNHTFIGAVVEKKNSTFFLTFQAGKVDGYVVLTDDEQAYHYFSDEDGNTYVEEEDIHDVLCINYNMHTPSKSELQAENDATQKISSEGPANQLESLPGATAVILLDFDGEYVSNTYWNGGNPIDAAPSGFSDSKIKDVYRVISEDFAPFNINITTNEAVYNAAPQNRRMRCIFSPTNTAAPGAGGVAYINSFRWNRDDPCWVFNSSTRGAAEAGSHEIGHTLGLGHDGRDQPDEEYYTGHGDWCPIMGAGYYEPIVQWSKGEYNNASNTQDDIAIIAGTGNGFGFRADDHANTLNSAATELELASNGDLTDNNNGIIEQENDVDIFRFTTQGGLANVSVTNLYFYPNLDIELTLFDNNGNTIATSNPTGLDASISETLSAGTYYLQVDGVGAGDPATNGYSDYGSIGQFFLEGNIESVNSNTPPTVTITSPANNSSFAEGSTINITADANDPDGSITFVRFFIGSTLLYEDLTSPYETIINSLSVGTHFISVVARDNDGAVAQDAIQIEITNPITDIDDLTAVVNDCNSVSLSWSDVQGEDGYRVSRLEDGESMYITLIELPANTGSYQDFSAKENTIYSYRVSPLQSGTAVKTSNTPQVMTPACEVEDCAGIIGGSAFIDECEICAGGNTGIEPNSTCADCNGDPNGTAFIDQCNVCAGGNTGIEPNSTCTDCNGDINGTAFIDNCNVCAGGNTGIEPNSSCTDCNGDVGGSAFIDSCGVCAGGNTGITPNQSCTDCNGDPNGTAFIDQCNVCAGGNTGIDPNSTCSDCNGDINGTANIDQCGICSGGNTGIEPNSTCTDCNGDINGSAFIDQCNVCAGGNTGIAPNSTCGSDCEVADQYSPSSVYATPGTKVIYQGKLFQNKWYTSGQTPGDPNGPWKLIDFCDAPPLDCSNTTTWSSGTIYSNAGIQVEHLGNLYTNRWYTSGQEPGTNEVWVYEGPCASQGAQKEVSSSTTLRAYPSPFESSVQIEIGEDYLGGELKVMSALGGEITKVNITERVIKIDLSSIPPGMYFIKVSSDSGSETTKIIKE